MVTAKLIHYRAPESYEITEEAAETFAGDRINRRSRDIEGSDACCRS
jgi:hypothetical protein